MKSRKAMGLVIGVLAGALGLTAAAQEEDPSTTWLQTVEVALDAPEKGLQVLSVRMTPGVTRTYDKLRFECVYRQEYDWTDSAGHTQRRINEPVRFAYERDDMRLTDDLDAHVSFKAPIATELLRERYGINAFKPDIPVAISRLRIEAVAGDATVWAYEVPTTPGPRTLADADRTDLATSGKATTPKPRSERAKFGKIDLD